MANLRTESSGSREPVRFPIENGETTIGRHPQCTIVVDAGAVSRLHAKVVRDGDRYTVADAGSRNGTFLNGQLLTQPQPLRTGDCIRISEVEFVFEGDDATDFEPDSMFAGTSGFGRAPESSAVPQEMTFDGSQFGIMIVDEADSSSKSKIEFLSSSDGVKMVATDAAKLQALMQINRQLGNALALDEVLPGVLGCLFDIFPAADRGFVVMESPDGNLIPRWVKTRRKGSTDDETVRISRTIIRQVMESGEALMSFDAADDSRFDSSQSIADFSIRSLICAPLLNSEGKAFGVLQIDSTQGRGQFREGDVDLFAGVAAQAGIIINSATLHENAIRQKEIEQDLKLATEVQKAYLPTSAPNAPGFSVSSFYKAANHIGGDYFDYVHLADGRVAIVLADVVGHGVAAAMLMAKLSAETRYCLASEPNLGRAIEKLNDNMSQLMVDRFVTFILVVIDPRDSAITIVNAGHMPPIVRRSADGSIFEPGEVESGLPIGISEGLDYESVRCDFHVGDIAVLYTDGINEAMDANDNEFGMDRVRMITSQARSAESVIKEIVDSVLKHVGKAPPFDDMCLVVIERTADPIQPLQKTSAQVEGNDFERSLVETASEEQLVARDTDV
jgi:phosphoserine phosphatase RsbU/P